MSSCMSCSCLATRTSKSIPARTRGYRCKLGGALELAQYVWEVAYQLLCTSVHVQKPSQTL